MIDEVLEKETQAFDMNVLQVIRRLLDPLQEQVMTGITFFGQPSARKQRH